ncbi:hypothetical protein ABW19_dt0201963 [Dactylella cylindrospora]|nr:hypothetical protein ABW19_dt0201963 [Dactylella cylindrospora]
MISSSTSLHESDCGLSYRLILATKLCAPPRFDHPNPGLPNLPQSSWKGIEKKEGKKRVHVIFPDGEREMNSWYPHSKSKISDSPTLILLDSFLILKNEFLSTIQKYIWRHLLP